jgi:peroxiredoxin
MVKLEQEFRKEGLVLLGITSEPPETVQAFVQKAGYRFNTLLDPKDVVSDQYAFHSTPTIIFIGRRGQVLGRAIGARNWDSAEGRTLLRHLLALP